MNTRHSLVGSAFAAFIAAVLACPLSGAPRFGDIEVFDTPPAATEDTSGIGLAAGDLNGDTYDDVVTIYANTGYVTLGGPASGPRTRIEFPQTTAYFSYDLALADLDRDGDLDLVIANNDPSNSTLSHLLVHLNEGAGVLSPAITLPMVGVGIEVADMNGDGYADIISEDAHIYFHVSTGPLAFAARTDVSLLSGLVAVGRISDDDVPDIVSRGAVRISTASAGVGTDFPFVAGFFYAKTLADLSGDGQMEVAVTGPDLPGLERSTRLHIFRYENDSLIETSQHWLPVVTPAAVCASDYDGDGDTDLTLISIPQTAFFNFVTSYIGSQTLFLENDGTGQLSIDRSSPSGGITGSAIVSGRIDDIPGDDLVVANRGEELFFGNVGVETYARRIAFIQGTADASSGPQQIVSGTNAGTNDGEVVSAIFVDVNSDSIDDIIGATNSNLFARLGRGSGVFDDTPVLVSNAPSINNVTLADIDSDGQPEIVASRISTETFFEVTVTPSTNPAQFVPGFRLDRTQLSTDTRITRNARSYVADLDQDGDGDYVTFSTSSSSVNTSEIRVDRRENGAWVRSVTPLPGLTSRLWLIDANSDAAPDLVRSASLDLLDPSCSCRHDWRVELYFNDGQGNFSASQTLLQSGSDILGLAVGDIFGDARADIVVATADSLVRVYTRSGAGFSTPVVELLKGHSLTQPVIGDFDLDGNPDLAGPTFTGQVPLDVGDLGTTSLFLFGNGLGAFVRSAELVNHPVTPWLPLAHDYNADGALDYISLNAFGGITLYPNLSTPTNCPADANGDLLIDGRDLSLLLSTFGDTSVKGRGADLNSDGVIDGADLGVLLSQYGTACQ